MISHIALAQIVAIIIFITMFVLIVMDRFEKHHITLVCGVITLTMVFGVIMNDGDAIIQTLNLHNIFTMHFWYTAGSEGGNNSGINWETIIFIAGMMIMVEGMARVGFFRWLCLKIASLVKYKTVPIFVTFMLMSAILAMFIDSITVILFLAAVTVELARLLKFNPVPMILAEIFCANLGGSATMCGDPPNIIIGTSLGYSFADFITNTGIIAGVCFIVTLVYFYFMFRNELKKNSELPTVKPDPKSAITDIRGFIISTVIFIIAVALLITHSMTHLTVAFIGVFISILTLLTAPKHIVYIIKKVDYKTLLMFIGLFMVIGGLEETGVLEIIAGLISKICGGNIYIAIAIIIWLSAVASAFIDNIPFAATMIPVIKSMSATMNVPIDIFAWTLALGTDIGGSATPIGASANVVGTAVSAKAGHPIGWKRYCTAAAPITCIVITISMLAVFIKARYI
ncbi:MAG: SLC13 family permease [Clostridiales bacterium]|nr:SLC13 family permease [Clostridiales bacterium]